MLINLIKLTKLPVLATRTHHFLTPAPITTFKMFGTDKQKQTGAVQSDSTQNDKTGPTVIEISKEEFIAMRQFVDNIKLSMPTPNGPPTSSNNNSVSSNTQLPSQTNSNQKPAEAGQVYFSSEEHILSFKLLKLSESQQFVSIFNQHKSTDKINLKLIILYRYVSLSGIIDKNSLKVEQRLAYQYLDSLKDNMAKFQQHELEQFLELYLNLQNSRKEAGNKQSDLPRLSVDHHEGSLPLIQTPSRQNSRVLMLLLRFYEIQYQNINNPQFKVKIGKILKHYELQTQIDSSGQVDYPLNQIAYIGMWAHFCDLEDFIALPLLIQTLKTINQPTGSKLPIDHKKIFKTVQTILQSHEKLGESSLKMLQKFDELALQFTKYIDTFTKQPLSLSKREELQQNLAEEKEDKIIEFNSIQNSGQVSSLLHSCLLALLEKSNVVILKFAVPLASIIIRNIFTYLNKTNFLPVAEYAEYWQSSMVMFKLVKAGNQNVTEKQLKQFVSSFMGKININECIKSTLNEETGAVIQQLAEDMERRLFETLVGFRIIVPPDFKFCSPPENNIGEISQEQSIKKNRNALRDLLVGYRAVLENLYKCGLVTSSQNPQIHNLIITCMISEAYALQNSELAAPKNYVMLVLTPTIREILAELGTKHNKYGQYAKKTLEKYREY